MEFFVKLSCFREWRLGCDFGGGRVSMPPSSTPPVRQEQTTRHHKITFSNVTKKKKFKKKSPFSLLPGGNQKVWEPEEQPQEHFLHTL